MLWNEETQTVKAALFFNFFFISGLLLNRLKDGLPAAEKCARYMVKDYSLIIKDVAEEDAGNYTIILSIRQWNLSKNLTVTLKVNGKFTACSHTFSEHKHQIFIEQLILHGPGHCALSYWLSWTQIQASCVGWWTLLEISRQTLVFIRRVSVFHSHILVPDDLNVLVTTHLTQLIPAVFLCPPGDFIFFYYSPCRNVGFSWSCNTLEMSCF